MRPPKKGVWHFAKADEIYKGLGLLIADAAEGCHGAYKLYPTMVLVHSGALETRARFMEVEQEAQPGEASERTWTEKEPAEAQI